MERLDTREKHGAIVCGVGLVCNLLLSVGKLTVGLLCGLVSVTADGFNNLSDCGSGIVALVSIFIAAKPADKEHPYGHRRAEYIASMLTGLIVLLMAVELLRGSILSIVEGKGADASSLVYIVLSVSIAVKAGMAILYRIGAGRLDLDTLRAASTDSLCDCLATVAAIVGAALYGIFPAADGIAGIAVSLFILWQGARLLSEAVSKLLGRAPDPALSERIREMSLSAQGVLGVHDLKIYSYGKGVFFATVHVEMDAGTSMLDAHTVIDGLEQRVKRETGVDLTVHLDPVDLTNREESVLKLKVGERVREIAEGAEMHDLRLIPNSDQVEFDVGVPYGCKLSDAAILEVLTAAVKEFGDYTPIINIERE